MNKQKLVPLFLVLSGCLYLVPANAQTYSGSGRRPPNQLTENQLTMLDHVNRQIPATEDRFEILAIILVESNLNHEAVSRTGDYGLMQVNCRIWRQTLLREFEIHDCEAEMMSVQTSLMAGIYILNRFKRYRRCRGSRVYACYNGGQNWRGRAENCEAACADDACKRRCWRPMRYSDSVRRHIRFLRRNYADRIQNINTTVGSPHPG